LNPAVAPTAARSFHPQFFIPINASAQNRIVGGGGGMIITTENTMATPNIAWYVAIAIRNGELKTAATSVVTGRTTRDMSKRIARIRSGATGVVECRIL
jgi:hypothetical protein